MTGTYDVIIIGAGPGGLECANQLKNSSLSVLLIEKNKIIGPKVCAGGLTHLDAGFDIPNEKTRSFLKQEFFINHSSYVINLNHPLRTISRLDLGQHQLNKIENCKNITILKETVVNEIKNDRVVTSKGIFYFKYLVGADGSNSKVRGYLGLPSAYCIGICYDVKTITDRFIWYVHPKQLKSGYIWVFPHKAYTNIGVYFDPKIVTPDHAKEALHDFMNSHSYDFAKSKASISPINYVYKGCVFNNIFLVGDASGLTSKAIGEGISFALMSGREIGKKIRNSEYKMYELESILIFKKRQENILKLFELFPFLQTLLFMFFVFLMKKKWFQTYFGN